MARRPAVWIFKLAAVHSTLLSLIDIQRALVWTEGIVWNLGKRSRGGSQESFQGGSESVDLGSSVVHWVQLGGDEMKTRQGVRTCEVRSKVFTTGTIRAKPGLPASIRA